MKSMFVGAAAKKQWGITKLEKGFVGLEEHRCWQWVRELVVHEEERVLTL